MAHLVFVYGTLLTGCGNHRVIEAGDLVGPAITDAEYTMISLGGFPGVIEGGRVAVAGELYRVSDTTLASLDQLEGNGNFYTRIEREITTTDGELVTAWVYCLPAHYLTDHSVIESGSWREHLRRNPPKFQAWIETAWTDDDASDNVDASDDASDWNGSYPWEEEQLEIMCAGCDTREARVNVIGMDLCCDCAKLFGSDEEGDA